MTLLQHHLLALGLIGATTTTLGLCILSNNPKRFLNRLFTLYMMSVAWWSFWELWGLCSPNETIATVRFRTEYLGCCFIPTLFYHGTVALAGAQRKFELLMSYAFSAIFTMLIAALDHPLMRVGAISIAYLPYWGKAGPLYVVFVSFFAVVVLRALQTLWRAAQSQQSPLRTMQFRLLFAASALAYLGGTPEFILKYGVRIPFLNPYGLYLIPLHVIMLAYAIVQFRLFDIHVVIRRSLVYSILVTLLTVGYFGLVYGIERLFQTTFGYQSFWLSLAAFAIMALAFQPLKIGIQRAVDWLFFRAPHEELVRRIERLEQETRHTEKLKAISTLAAGMAHEIKNPLASIKTFAEYLPQKGDDPSFRQKFGRIVGQEVEKINALVQRLLEFAKPAQPQKQPTRLSQLIDETVELLQGRLLSQRIELIRAYGDQETVPVDPAQMKQALLNVLLNSIEAMERPGRITIATVPEDGHLDVVVSDTGSGIAKKDLARVCDPFYTTKPAGTGLGLSVVHSIVQEHGGRVAIESDVGRGTTVRIRLPVS
jgi:signal transduction histidine kinase